MKKEVSLKKSWISERKMFENYEIPSERANNALEKLFTARWEIG